MILFRKSLIFGKLNVSHHNFIHGNVFKPQSPFSSFSRVAVLKYKSLYVPCNHFILILFFKISSTWPIWGLFDHSSLSTATKLRFCGLEISTGSIPSSSSLETSFSLVFTFISSLRGNFCTFFTLLYLPRYTYKKVYSVRLIKLICY